MKRLISLALMLAAPLTFAAPSPCSSPEHRLFDFWLGDWRVTKPDGSVAGTNHITREYGGDRPTTHYLDAAG